MTHQHEIPDDVVVNDENNDVMAWQNIESAEAEFLRSLADKGGLPDQVSGMLRHCAKLMDRIARVPRGEYATEAEGDAFAHGYCMGRDELVDRITNHLCEKEYDIGGRDELRKHVAAAPAPAVGGDEKLPVSVITQSMIDAGTKALVSFRKSGDDWTGKPAHAARVVLEAALQVPTVDSNVASTIHDSARDKESCLSQARDKKPATQVNARRWTELCTQLNSYELPESIIDGALNTGSGVLESYIDAAIAAQAGGEG